MVLNQAESILEKLIAVIEKKEHPCVVANQWAQFELNTLLWFFYLVYSQVQVMLTNKSVMNGSVMSQLNKLASLLNPIMIFAQIDKINTLQKKLSNNMNVNSTLVLEDLLFDL
jgi:DNA polymerase-3 subunit delta'